MNDKDKLIINMGRFMVDTRHTVKNVAKEFEVSPSTAYRYIKNRLPELNADVAEQCRVIMEYHKSIRHLRGGEGNRMRFKSIFNGR